MFLCVFFFHLIGIVVSCVVKVVTDGRGQHDEQVHAVHLPPQVSQPDQPVHLSRQEERRGMMLQPRFQLQQQFSGALTLEATSFSSQP